jgi:hypothetical protein
MISSIAKEDGASGFGVRLVLFLAGDEGKTLTAECTNVGTIRLLAVEPFVVTLFFR